MDIRYEGTSNFRVLDAADMKQYGIEDFKKTTFARGEVVEASDEHAEVLLHHEDFAGEFVEHKEEDEPELMSRPVDENIANVENNEAAAPSGHTGESTGTGGGTTQTPRATKKAVSKKA